MTYQTFPVIDLPATGANILRLRRDRGLSVRDLQRYFGFEEPQAIYKWQRGQSLPTVDNLYALSTLLDVPMNDILVPSRAATPLNIKNKSHGLEPVALAFSGRGGHGRMTGLLRPLSAASWPSSLPKGGGMNGTRRLVINEISWPKPNRSLGGSVLAYLVGGAKCLAHREAASSVKGSVCRTNSNEHSADAFPNLGFCCVQRYHSSAPEPAVTGRPPCHARRARTLGAADFFVTARFASR